MNREYIIAYDCGTTAVKAVVVDDGGSIVCSANEEYPLIQLQPGWAEQDPAVLWNALCNATKVVLRESGVTPREVCGIVFAAPWKNIIPMDAEGNVLRNSLIWMDARASEQAERLNRDAGFFVGTGQEYWPRLMWVKEKEPEIWAKARHIIGLNTYFKWRATGEYYTEPHDDFIHAFNPNIQAYYNNVLKAAGMTEEDLEKFPAAKLSTDQMGETTTWAAAEMGLRPGIPVFGGFGDLPAITIGTGCCSTNQVHIYFGTSSWLVSILDERIEGFAPQYFIFDPHHDGAMFALQTGCLAYDWAVEQLYHAEKAMLKGKIHRFVDGEVAEVEPGSMNLVATHWLNGELPPLAKNAKALYFNLTTSHDRRHMVRAMMESVCYTHRMNVERFTAATGKPLESIRVVGGGAVSDLWMQMLADVLQVTVMVPQAPRFTGAMGSYYCAMIGLGRLENYDAIYDEVKIAKEFKPNPKHAPVYDKLYRIYTQLYPSLKPLYDQINGVY